MALREGVWLGENHLGRLWMHLRDQLRQSDPGGKVMLA
jgi:hypothetical protein